VKKYASETYFPTVLLIGDLFRHPNFRHGCVRLAQALYRFEVRMRTGLLGEPAKQVRPLSEAKYVTIFSFSSPTFQPRCRAIDNGANFLAEGFLFSVAAALIITETWRSSRSETKRREGVQEQIEDMKECISGLQGQLNNWEQRFVEATERCVVVVFLPYLYLSLCHSQEELTRVLDRVVEIGLRGRWIEFQDTPLRIPRLELSGRSHDKPPNPPRDISDFSEDSSRQ
jgi:hypothetical protein